jgi:hypothetical protein
MVRDALAFAALLTMRAEVVEHFREKWKPGIPLA